jgi:hypothetical protein
VGKSGRYGGKKRKSSTQHLTAKSKDALARSTKEESTRNVLEQAEKAVEDLPGQGEQRKEVDLDHLEHTVFTAVIEHERNAREALGILCAWNGLERSW